VPQDENKISRVTRSKDVARVHYDHLSGFYDVLAGFWESSRTRESGFSSPGKIRVAMSGIS